MPYVKVEIAKGVATVEQKRAVIKGMTDVLVRELAKDNDYIYHQTVPAEASVPAVLNPEAAKAMTAIKQQMQEMQTLLSWLRPVKKPQQFGKAA